VGEYRGGGGAQSRQGATLRRDPGDCNAATILADSLTWGAAPTKRVGHGLCPAAGGTPDSETKEKCKGRDGLEGWQAACRQCTDRYAPGGAVCALIASGMTARKTGAAFAYRSKGHDRPARGWRGPCPFRGGGRGCWRE